MKDNGLDIFRYTPPYGPEDMQREIDILRAALAKSNAERDEARRELCRIESSASGDPNMTSRAVAADLGWDCFKEDGK